MATSEGIPSSIDIEFLELNDNPYYIPENSKPYSLGYRKDGKFMESFGTGFYDEASNLAFELL